MISDDLYRLADRIAGDVLRNHTPSQVEMAAIAQQLISHAKTTRVLETLPFSVTTWLVEEVTEGTLVRAVEADLGGTPEQWR